MKVIHADPTTTPWQDRESTAVVLNELEGRTALPDEMLRVVELLNDEHDLGAGPQIGHSLVQIVHYNGRWAALFVWGPADYHPGCQFQSPERALPLKKGQIESLREGELTAAKRLYETIDLYNAVV